jgi:8-oxo-dGTP pyrophosphatase MutT (NUDIX family)
MGSPQSAILAAGGIVIRHDADGDKIAIVQRRRYPGEMALPKGKIEEGEAIPAAAQRETSEETGCEVTDPRFAGAVHYLVGDVPKVVFFYLMELVREDPAGPKDTREIEAVKWMSPAAAVKALTHADVRRLITDIFGLFPFQVQATTSIAATITRVCWGAFGSPERDRLAATITETRIELDSLGADITITPWARAADQYLVQAESCLRSCNLQHGWVTVHSAQRTILANSKIEKAIGAATALRRELDKVTGWRAKAISDLICDKDGALRKFDCPNDIFRVVDAVGLRDDHFNNSYFKILLRRRHLVVLLLILFLTVVFCLFMWPPVVKTFLPQELQGPLGFATVILAGILGAGVSVAQSLLSTDVSAKIPAQQIGSFLVWMRPAIGAAAALVAIALLGAGKEFKFLDENLFKNPAAILVIAFVAGFSERFITGAIERISEQSSKTKSS